MSDLEYTIQYLEFYGETEIDKNVKIMKKLSYLIKLNFYYFNLHCVIILCFLSVLLCCFS